MPADPRGDPARAEPAAGGLAAFQRRMARAVLTGDPAAATETAAALRPGRIPAAARLEIHRANVAISLVKALEAAFPVVARLMTPPLFRATARTYVERHPPRRPQLSVYGDRFPAFLAPLGPARALPCLADVARLEWARVEALFAADAPPLAPEALTGVAEAEAPSIVFLPHPSLRLVASPHPIQAIWAATQSEPPARVDPAAGGETVLLLRRGAAVTTEVVSPAEAAFLSTILKGRALAEASAAAEAADPAHDLQRALLANLTRGSFAGWHLAGEPTA